MMALAYDDVPVAGDEIFDISFALQTLDHGNMNHAGSLDLSSSNLTDAFQLAYPVEDSAARLSGG
jgi:hypothetical protein